MEIIDVVGKLYELPKDKLFMANSLLNDIMSDLLKIQERDRDRSEHFKNEEYEMAELNFKVTVPLHKRVAANKKEFEKVTDIKLP